MINNKIAAAALDYCRRGLRPVLLKPRTKEPVGNAWQKQRYGESDIPRIFTNAHNIGLQMGMGSPLVDVELDSDTMRILAPQFLPATRAIFGRTSKPRSHWLYRCPALHDGEHDAGIPLKDADGKELGSLRIGDDDKGAQSMAPPSIHPSGEAVAWADGCGPEPAEVGAELETRFRYLGAAALLADHWPREEGSRNAIANAAAGWLARAEVPEDDAEAIIGAAADLAKDDEARSRRTSVRYTYKKHENGDPVTGWKALSQLIDGRAAAALRKALAAKSLFPDLTKDGAPRPTLANTKVAIKALDLECRHNLFDLRYEVGGHALAQFVGTVSDPALLWLREHIHERFRFDPNTDTVLTAVMTLANHHRYHPVCDYLNSLKWDGTRRIDNWLVSYCGADDTEFIRTIGAIVLIAAVRRVRQPGCKFDEMLVLESPEGFDKSGVLQALAVRSEWFTDSVDLRLKGRETIEQTSGKWLCEIAELQGMRKAEIEHVKSWLSRRTDEARLAYARTKTEARRQFIPFGTTNSSVYLRSQDGNRRFWPVAVQRCDLAAVERDRDQLWAEAAVREAAGASIRLPEHLWEVAAEEQDERVIENQFLQPLASLLKDLEGKVTTENLWLGLGIPLGRQSALYTELGNAMRDLGWKPAKRFRTAGKPRRGFVKGPEPHRPIICWPPDRMTGLPGQADYEKRPTTAADRTVPPRATPSSQKGGTAERARPVGAPEPMCHPCHPCHPLSGTPT